MSLLKRTERQIFSYDMAVVARAQHAQPPRLQEIVDAWKVMLQAGTCSHERDKGSVIYRIGAIDEDSAAEVVHILMRRCDTNAANAVYSHKITGVPRIAHMDEDEGGDRAAHIIVSLKNETQKPASYLCHLEGVSGLSHTLVQATLNAVLKRAITTGAASFRYPDPAGARLRSGEPKTSSFIPTIELLGHPSPDLIDDIENGQLQDVVLVQQRANAQLGGNQYLEESEFRLKVNVLPNMPRQNRVQKLIAALQSRRSDFQTAKVRFIDPNGVTRTVDYDIDTGHPEQQKYVRWYKVSDINPPMDESCENLVPFLIKEMQQKLVTERT